MSVNRIENTEKIEVTQFNTDDSKPKSEKIKQLEESDEDSIQELCVIKNSIDASKRENYYDDDLVIDRKKVLERWNIKKCADQNINYSKMNYRLRVLKDTKIPKKREFRMGIFCEDKSEFDLVELLDTEEENRNLNKNDDANLVPENPRFKESQGENSEKQDEIDLETKMNCIENNLKDVKSSLNNEFKVKIARMQNNFNNYLNSVRNNHQLSESEKHEIQGNAYFSFNQSKSGFIKSYKFHLTSVKIKHNNEKKALKALYDSGNFKKGKLREYTTINLYQPKSKRRKYDDDGHRQMILLEKDAKNILIEDQIYEYFYGNCT